MMTTFTKFKIPALTITRKEMVNLPVLFFFQKKLLHSIYSTIIENVALVEMMYKYIFIHPPHSPTPIPTNPYLLTTTIHSLGPCFLSFLIPPLLL